MADKPAQIEVEYLEGMGGVAASQPAEKNPSSLEAAERHPRDGPAPPLRPPSSRAIGNAMYRTRHGDGNFLALNESSTNQQDPGTENLSFHGVGCRTTGL